MATLSWIGKNKVINHHQEVPFKVIKNIYNFNIDIESENKIIYGDNLLALKSLLPRFESLVDVVYIDPPYNTGNDGWIYNDNVNDPKILKWIGEVVGKEGEDLSRHDKWLCMIYPRLKLLHKLLSDQGVIFISIDDNEYQNLKYVMDEIFGKRNFLGVFIKQSKVGGGSDSKHIVKEHEYLLSYSKNSSLAEPFFIEHDEKYLKRYKERDDKGRYFWDTFARPGLKNPIYFDIETPDGTIINRGWIHSESRFKEELENGEIRIKKNNKGEWTVHFKQYLNSSGKKPRSMTMDFGGTFEGKKELKRIFGDDKIFPYPKSSYFIKQILSMVSNKNAIVLDSFAGSGTTSQAVLELNKSDGGNRKFILIELMDYANRITAERAKRVISGYDLTEGTGGNFSYFELGENLFDEEGNLNEDIEISKIKEYIFFMETREDFNENKEHPYYLGSKNEIDYYFVYEKDKITDLGYDTLEILQRKTQAYVIYADTCSLSEEELQKYNIVFKKIPRDIKKL